MTKATTTKIAEQIAMHDLEAEQALHPIGHTNFTYNDDLNRRESGGSSKDPVPAALSKEGHHSREHYTKCHYGC